MAGRRPPKKSDPLVVRMPHEDKEAFLDACRRDGRTASDVVRDLIGGYVRRAEVRARLRDIQPERSLAMIWKSPKTRIAAAASAAAGALASVALLSAPSVAAYDYRASFNMLDVDGDGAISMDEYAGSGSRSTVAMEFGPPPVGTTFTLGGVLEDAEVPLESKVVFDFTYDIDFGVADDDGDGSVDFDEFVRRHEQLLARQFALQDLDGNGRLSSAELIGQSEPHGLPAAVFFALDHNEDGAITLQEFQDGPSL